jgi:hypothetical protein
MDGITDTGIFYESPKHSRELKVDSYGHTWVTVITFTLSRTEVLEQMQGEKVHLDSESIADVSVVVCFRCELAFQYAAHHDCPGEPKGYNSDGRPVHHQRWVREMFKTIDEEKKSAGTD